MESLATAPIDGSASPRKPSVRMRERSSSASLEVAWRSTESTRSALSMPEPSSVTRITPRPPPVATMSMREAPASIAFSTSSLTTLAGRSTTSPAAMRLTRLGGSSRIAMTCLGAGEIPAGQHFTRFYRRLVERVDTEQVGGEDRFQHEMHHERAERALVQDFQIDGPHRPPGSDQGLGDGALLRGDQVSRRLAREIFRVGELGEVRSDARPPANTIFADHSDEVLWRAIEIKLQLAVLIDRPKRRDRGGPLPVFAQAFGPELHIPGGKTRQAVAVRQHDVRAHAALPGKTDSDGSADCRREVASAPGVQQRINDALCPFPQRHHVEATGESRKETHVGESRKAAADIGIVVEHGDGEMLAERAQAVGLPFHGRLGDGEKQLWDARLETGLAPGIESGGDLHQSLGRAARFRDDDEACRLEVKAGERKIERAGIEIVVEARARALFAAVLVVPGDAPAAELRQRLPAEARPAGAEENERAGAVRQLLQARARGFDVVAPLRDAQQRECSLRVSFAERDETRLKLVEVFVKRGLRKPEAADGGVETAFHGLF